MTAQCEYLRMPVSIGRGRDARQCERTARWVVVVRQGSKFVEKAYCGHHAKSADYVQSCHPMAVA